MTPIGIMSAMHEELAAVLQALPDEQRVQVAGRDFWQGHWHGRPVVAVLSRIGKVAAATTATALIERFGVGQIVFTGVAGGLGSGVKVGDVVLARSLVQHDMDASPLFPRHEVPLYGRSRFDTDVGLSASLRDAARVVLAQVADHVGPEAVSEFDLQSVRLHEGLIASGDRFVSTTAECRSLQQALPEALAVEMEGAAVALSRDATPCSSAGVSRQNTPPDLQAMLISKSLLASHTISPKTSQDLTSALLAQRHA